MAQTLSEHDGRTPTILTVPGLGNSGPAHWQTLWEQSRTDTIRADLGNWTAPRRNPWVTRLDQAIRNARAPVILAAHGLGCLAVAWWAALAGQTWGWPVAGALLVAPPDVDRADVRPEHRDFGPGSRVILPFPAILVSGSDDPYASPQRAFDMARDWGAHHVNAGPLGHLNAASGIGWWSEGQQLLDRLIGVASHPVAHAGGPTDVMAALADSGEAVVRH
jgi:predicted alpha/beta hydrolase family esterase